MGRYTTARSFDDRSTEVQAAPTEAEKAAAGKKDILEVQVLRLYVILCCCDIVLCACACAYYRVRIAGVEGELEQTERTNHGLCICIQPVIWAICIMFIVRPSWSGGLVSSFLYSTRLNHEQINSLFAVFSKPV